MGIDYPTDNINNMIRAVKRTEWAGRDLDTMVELGYIIMHGDFSDDNLTGMFPPYDPCEFCDIPQKYTEYSLRAELGDNREDIVHYFRMGLDFIINYIEELWCEVLQKLNNWSKRDTWVYKEFIGFMEENKDKYPEQYLEMVLL